MEHLTGEHYRLAEGPAGHHGWHGHRVACGVALIRALADNIGLTAGLSKALASGRLLVHDRGRVLADLACAIADGAEVISDFRVIGDQEGLFGLVASVPTAWRTLDEIAGGGQRALNRITGRHQRRAAPGLGRDPGPAWSPARHPDRGQDTRRRDLHPAGCQRRGLPLKEGAEPNFKGFEPHPLLAYCDNTAEPLAGMLWPGSAGSNTPADHLAALDAAITALSQASRVAAVKAAACQAFSSPARWRGTCRCRSLSRHSEIVQSLALEPDFGHGALGFRAAVL
jgi:hypothetical protein